MKHLKALLIGFLSISLNTLAQEQKEETTLDSVQDLSEVIIKSHVILGNKHVAKNRTGSAYYLSSEELKKYNYTNINRVLASVPGVNLVEEDGFGLRPNISLRGTSPERSAKISLMEDGVLIAPAPYSASSAYYFPSVARMEAIEILKGSSQVQYGPFTTGGAINMVSSAIPDSFSGNISGSYGSFNTQQWHASVGDSKNLIGYQIEYLNYNSDGFKSLPNQSNTGFDKNDFMAKFRVNTPKDVKIQQAVELKFQYSDEVSNETYLGLTDADFSNSPFDRYAGSQKDKMTNDHLQFMVSHDLNFSENLKLVTKGYYNSFSRNWYKLNDVTANGDKVGIANIVEQPEAYSSHYNLITGSLSSTSDDYLAVKANNRDYISKGVQTKLDYHYTIGNTFHDLEIGARYHYDEEDRFQWVDKYGIYDQTMVLVNAGVPGTDANRISSAKAFAAFAMYKLKFNNWTIAPGIRYENIELMRSDYGKNDVSRIGTELSNRDNQVDVFIPGIGANYKFNNQMSLFGGIHKGFSPPGNEPGQKPEESLNYELGGRFNFMNISGEVVGFYNQYSNLLGSDSAASGGTGSLDQFNAGEVNVYGLEVLLNYDFLRNNANWNLPIALGYTFTDTEFLTSFDSDEGIWGEVTEGDEIPYISKHQANASMTLENKHFLLALNGRYNGAFRTVAGTGDIPANQKVDGNIVIDFSGKYFATKYLALTGRIINLLDNTYAVSRTPAGLRPGHPFGIYGGIELQF